MFNWDKTCVIKGQLWTSLRTSKILIDCWDIGYQWLWSDTYSRTIFRTGGITHPPFFVIQQKNDFSVLDASDNFFVQRCMILVDHHGTFDLDIFKCDHMRRGRFYFSRYWIQLNLNATNNLSPHQEFTLSLIFNNFNC